MSIRSKRSGKFSNFTFTLLTIFKINKNLLTKEMIFLTKNYKFASKKIDAEKEYGKGIGKRVVNEITVQRVNLGNYLII